MFSLLPLVFTAVVHDTADTVRAAEIVVTGGRGRQQRTESPVLVSTTQAQALTSIQASSLADGLSFQPGLRLELNCQNCGFTQVRLQGLPGPYAQILIDSRPVFSALNGVYGLEQIPAAMIDRIEVVRGAGSAMYGAGAVAGTINVITRRPEGSTYTAMVQPSWIGGRSPDHYASVLGSTTDASYHYGITAFGAVRDRTWYDHNGDGYSELPSIHSTAAGVRGTAQLAKRGLLMVDAHAVREHRRGGQLTERPVQVATIAEDLAHTILGGAVTYEWSSADERWEWAAYASGTHTLRDSYYGGIGEDSSQVDIAPLMFGSTTGLAAVVGLQALHYTELLRLPLRVVGGIEYRRDAANDSMPGYGRSIQQNVDMLSGYTQLQLAPGSPWSAAVGLRVDGLSIDGTYSYPQDDTAAGTAPTMFATGFERIVVNPRLSLIHGMRQDLQLRATYGAGFRGPQAFDEDFHISTLQGTARIIQLSPSLQPERSHSGSVSAEYSHGTFDQRRRFTADAFATYLANPFVVELQSEHSRGSAILATKRNGAGAYVAGLNLEYQAVRRQQYEITLAATAQVARYVEPTTIIERTDDAEGVTTTNIMRTPSLYGSALLQWQLTSDVHVNVSSVLTGPMQATNERTRTVTTTPWFLDAGLNVGYDLPIGSTTLQITAGVSNVLNTYQQDLEVGAGRDAAYVYGPQRPRTITIGLRLTNE